MSFRELVFTDCTVQCNKVVGLTLRLYYIYNANRESYERLYRKLWMCQCNTEVELDRSEAEHFLMCSLTIKPMDAHHKVYAVIKLLVILFRREVGEIWRQEREVAVQAGLEAQLFEQLLFGFVETGEKRKDIVKENLIL